MTHPNSESHDPSQDRQMSMSRRRFLRGLGACMALPSFESLLSSKAYGTTAASASLGKTATGAPKRMAFVYFPNGAQQFNWWPTGEDKAFELNKTMLPLAQVKDKIQVVRGVDQLLATPGSDGAGDHARASGTFLTGARARKTAGSDIHVGISIDQVAAQHIGHLTRFPSLELTCDSIRNSGNCDSGYSCAYQYNLSWRTPTTPMVPEPNPRLVFERLFGSGSQDERQTNFQRRQASQRSILDFVLEDARHLKQDLGQRDGRKLDEYLSSVRDIEQRIERAEDFGPLPDPGIAVPAGIPEDYQTRIRLMFDLLTLAFQTDSTRIATFLLAYEGSNRPFPEIGIAEGHHYLTHHGNMADKIAKVGQIDHFYVKQFAYFLEKLEQTEDADGGSILDNAMIVYGSGNADGNRHTHHTLPVILAGTGGGTLRAGRYFQTENVPMSNMYLSMLDRLGIEGVDQFGDSTGRLDTI